MKPSSQRLEYLDWLRGIAAVTMLQGHVFNSFLRTDQRTGGPYMMSQFAGGMPPAVFLFLLGVTFAFLMDSQERRGVPAVGRVLTALRRSGYLFAAAFAFRLQMWMMSFDISPWTDIFRVDVLNSMGFALLMFSAMAAFRTVERIRLSAILGVAIAAASPVISCLEWSSTPEMLRNYLIPDRQFFGFFPWAAFVAFGMSAGSILRRLKPDEVQQTMQWFAWGGVAMAFAAYTISSMSTSIYPNSDFWLNSPALIFIKLGVVLMLVAFSYLWNLQISGQWSWLRQFGMTSLLVYWVHIELVYGRWLGYFKERLNVGETTALSVVVIVAMLGLSLLRTKWEVVRLWFVSPVLAARRVSGD
jgi:uncharacterized membrane protein